MANSSSEMRRRWLAALAVAWLLLPIPGSAAARPPVTQVAVVGGLDLCGVWPRLATRAGAALRLRIETVAASPKEGVVPVFARGDADLLLIHGGDEAFALQAAGHAAPPRVWAWNEHIVAGPDADPAGVRQAADGGDAMRRIAAAEAPLVAFRDPGSHTVVQRLWRRAGIRPDERWLRLDTGATPQAILGEAASRQAYVVVGHIPVAFGKLVAPGMSVLLKGDPLMRRPYVVLTPGRHHPAGPVTRRNAERLARYLLSPAGQTALTDADRAAGGPWLFPLTSGIPPVETPP